MLAVVERDSRGLAGKVDFVENVLFGVRHLVFVVEVVDSYLLPRCPNVCQFCGIWSLLLVDCRDLNSEVRCLFVAWNFEEKTNLVMDSVIIGN